MGKKHNVTRRDFVKVMTGVTGVIIGGGIALPAIGYAVDPAIKSGGSGKDAWISLGPVENYPIGEPTPFNFTRTKVNGWEKTASTHGLFVLRKSDTEIKVFSNVCTHLACRVAWHKDKGEYVCPCHDGVFDKDGNVVSGPPPRPLDQYEYKIEDGNLFVRFAGG